jgi:hypothetical protein
VGISDIRPLERGEEQGGRQRGSKKGGLACDLARVVVLVECPLSPSSPVWTAHMKEGADF